MSKRPRPVTCIGTSKEEDKDLLVLSFLSGACAVIWSLVWLALVRNSPSEQSWITREEVEYIEMSLAADIQEKVLLTYKSNNGRETRLEFRNMLITILR